ncbi:chitinase-like protein 4 [Myzus persicae]|uniref:chitinase-like protein 4 n=1 Tax=Myzus persicae TaxID=13164 RepID=UPI000B93219B|nr:chitinase-like protein 4 [Myzus persicae]WRQ19969.1 Cht11-2 [Myzus persicae]
MARSSSRVITKVFLISVCVFAVLARPEDAKVQNKLSAVKSEKFATTLPATTVKKVDLQFSSIQQDESFPNVSEDVVDEAFNDMGFMRSEPYKCSNGEGLCDPTGQQIKNLNISSQTIKYSPDWTAENKTRSKRMDKLNNLACYYLMPSDYTLETLYPDEINPALCTHLIVTAARVQNNRVYFETTYDEEILRRAVNLREQNPKLKVLLSLQHFSDGSHSNEGFPGVVANKDNLDQFIFHVVSVVNEFYLDGIDINWQFPSWPLLNLEEKYGFAKLLETLRYHLPDSILTAAVAAPIRIIKQSYLMYPLANFVDFINVMAYDYFSYRWYFQITGPNSPLYSPRNESEYFQDLNINSSIHYWISNGIPTEKILLGMPTHGHSYKLKNEDNNGFNAPTTGLGIGEGGYVTFSESCEFKSHPNATTVFDLETLTPYAYHKNDWISFDDEKSLAFKVDYATTLNLGGAMVYSLNTDDYSGSSQCSITKFPLTSIIQLALNNNV